MAIESDLNKPPREMPPMDKRAAEPDLPSPEDDLPEIIIYGHSGIMYWWPVWLAGYVCAAITYASGSPFIAEGGERLLIYSGPGLGLTYVTILLLTVIFTNARLRGIYSVVAILAAAFVFVLLAWTGLLDDLAELIPMISMHMNAGFFLVTSTGLLIIWLLSFFVFDRLTFWRIRPGQLTQESWIGDSEESYDARGMLFEKHGEDFFRHRILGFGSGDLRLMTAGAKQATVEITDVLFVDKTVSRVQQLIMVEPNDLT